MPPLSLRHTHLLGTYCFILTLRSSNRLTGLVLVEESVPQPICSARPWRLQRIWSPCTFPFQATCDSPGSHLTSRLLVLQTLTHSGAWHMLCPLPGHCLYSSLAGPDPSCRLHFTRHLLREPLPDTPCRSLSQFPIYRLILRNTSQNMKLT